MAAQKTNNLQEHLESISKLGWNAKVKKYGLAKAKEMMREQSRKYWANHRVIHKRVKKPAK